MQCEALWDSYGKSGKGLVKDGQFNNGCMEKFMWSIYNKLGAQYRKVTVDIIDNKRVESYVNGLLWCLQMYKTGICPNYGYTYTGQGLVHPYEMLLYFCRGEVHMLKSDVKPIEASVYPLLIMPYAGKGLVPKKYHKLMDGELKYLYEVE